MEQSTTKHNRVGWSRMEPGGAGRHRTQQDAERQSKGVRHSSAQYSREHESRREQMIPNEGRREQKSK